MSGLLLTLDNVLYQLRRAGDGWELLALQGKRVGASYTVTEDGCTCPAAQFRQGPCKHRVSLGLHGLLPPVVEPAVVPD